MSVNKYRPHVWVLPEDDANRQLANGFLLHSDLSSRSVQVLVEAGGWNEVLEIFLDEHVAGMEVYNGRFIILLIDFDNHEDRLDFARSKIPEHLAERVFILGALTEPETLRRAVALTYEQIGLELAQDCSRGTDTIWDHPQLRHNSAELERLRASVRPILFPAV